MIEVFKTNVKDEAQSRVLINLLHKTFSGFKANFDLDDCDKILRVCGMANPLQAFQIINLLKDFGVQAEILPDEVQSSFTADNERYGGAHGIPHFRF